MKSFAELYDAIDRTTSTNAKVEAMVGWFRKAAPEDAVWALWLLMGYRFKRILPTKELVAAALAASGVPEWMFQECHAAVGDLAETIALLVESPAASADMPLHVWAARVRSLPTHEPEERARLLFTWWRSLGNREMFLLNKLLTGAFRVGVSNTLVTRALAEVTRVPAAQVAHRLMGAWEPNVEAWRRITAPEHEGADPTRPYPFMLASPLDDGADALGPVTDWIAEWKWDGIRAQCIRRTNALSLWSRGEELITERFPEIAAAMANLPVGTVLDGEVLGWRDGRPLPFADLQTRIGRKKLDAKVLAATPAIFCAFDLLEAGGVDLRDRPFAERRARLEALLPNQPVFRVSPALPAESWEDLARMRDESRERGVEGFVLKRRASVYTPGRHKGDWWKWKIAPYTLDAVLVYAQAGHGRRAGLHTDYTFAVWDNGALLPIAKAYSGLTNAEIEELDTWIRRHTRERFGPVRVVEPVLVFEIAFEGIALSSRHKSGVAVRFPRVLRRRLDKEAKDADTLENVKGLIRASP